VLKTEMPIVLVRSLALPKLKIYTTVSLLLVSGCLYYAFDVVRTDPEWKTHQNTSHHSTRPSSLLKSSSEVISIVANSDILSSLKSSLSATDENEELEASHQDILNEASPNKTNSLVNLFEDVASFMVQEPICIWVSKTYTY
jgi:hypothetical protein